MRTPRKLCQPGRRYVKAYWKQENRNGKSFCLFGQRNEMKKIESGNCNTTLLEMTVKENIARSLRLRQPLQEGNISKICKSSTMLREPVKNFFFYETVPLEFVNS